VAALAEIITPRGPPRAGSTLDIARDLLDPNSLIATAIYTTCAALEATRVTSGVDMVMAMLPESLEGAARANDL